MSSSLTRRDALTAMGALVAYGMVRHAEAVERPDDDPSGPADALVNRVFTDPDGHSHLGELKLSAREIRAGVTETEWLDAVGVSLRFLNPGPDFQAQPRHVAPRRNLSVILTGTLEVECSPTEIRRFGPGSLVLLEDTSGEGHITRIVGAPVSFVQVALKE